MNINSNLKQELLVSAKRELKNPFANIEGKKPEVKLPELVDKVTLTTVDSSSFDKYVEEMENGKQGVVDKFGKALESIFGDFVKGLSAATETEETKEVEETTAVTKEDTTKADASKTNDVKTGNAVADKYIAEYNTTLGHLKAKLDILLNERDELALKVQEIDDTYKKERAEVRANGNDANEYEKVKDNYERQLNICQVEERNLETRITETQARISAVETYIKEFTDISAKIGGLDNPEINEIVSKLGELANKDGAMFYLSADLGHDFNKLLNSSKFGVDMLKLKKVANDYVTQMKKDVMPQEIAMVSEKYDLNEKLNQLLGIDDEKSKISKEDAIRTVQIQYQLMAFSVEHQLLSAKLDNLYVQYEHEMEEAYKIEPSYYYDKEGNLYPDYSVRDEAIANANYWKNAEEARITQERKLLDREEQKLKAEYAKIDGTAKQTNNTESVNSTTTSNPTTTTTVSSGLNELEDEEDKENFEIKLNDDVKTNFFKKNPNLNLEKTRDKESKKDKNLKLEKEPKIDRNISRIIDNLGSSKPELEDVIDAFDNAGKRADFNSINKVAKQLDVHFGSSAIRKALKNA